LSRISRKRRIWSRRAHPREQTGGQEQGWAASTPRRGPCPHHHQIPREKQSHPSAPAVKSHILGYPSPAVDDAPRGAQGADAGTPVRVGARQPMQRSGPCRALPRGQGAAMPGGLLLHPRPAGVLGRVPAAGEVGGRILHASPLSLGCPGVPLPSLGGRWGPASGF